ncbi:hypothetical protein D3C87_1771760 [compost metagenome]
MKYLLHSRLDNRSQIFLVELFFHIAADTQNLEHYVRSSIINPGAAIFQLDLFRLIRKCPESVGNIISYKFSADRDRGGCTKGTFFIYSYRR